METTPANYEAPQTNARVEQTINFEGCGRLDFRGKIMLNKYNYLTQGAKFHASNSVNSTSNTAQNKRHSLHQNTKMVSSI